MAALLYAAAPDELVGDFSSFTSTFKRHTPFALDFMEQRVEGFSPASVEFTRGGDILMYTYLYTSNVVNWQSVLTSIDFLIGEQLIDTLPIEYIVEYWPLLSARSQSEFSYQNASFLPVPIPRIPVCALKYQSCRIRINGLTTPVKCQACYAYLGEERETIDDFDLLINQVQNKPVCTDGSVYLTNPVKYIWSNNVSTNRLIINGADYWTVSPDVGLYYSTKYAQNQDFTNQYSYNYFDMFAFNGVQPQGIRTMATAKSNVYMFSSSDQQAKLMVYNFGPMNSPLSWNVIPFELTDFGPPPVIGNISTSTGAFVQNYIIDLVPYRSFSFLAGGSFTVSSSVYLDALIIGGGGASGVAGTLSFLAGTLFTPGTYTVSAGAPGQSSTLGAYTASAGSGTGNAGAGGPGIGGNGGPGVSQYVYGSNVYVFSTVFNVTYGQNDGQNNFYYAGGGGTRTPGLGYLGPGGGGTSGPGQAGIVMIRYRTS